MERFLLRDLLPVTSPCRRSSTAREDPRFWLQPSTLGQRRQQPVFAQLF